MKAWFSSSERRLTCGIGVEQPAILRETQYAIGERLTLQIINVGTRVEVQAANRDDVPVYWGFKVRVEKRSFPQFVRASEFDLIIATAKLGSKFTSVAEDIEKKWRISKQVLVAFGAPSRGLHEIAKEEGTKLEHIVDFVVNTIPEQGTATVRTEEALFAALAVLNVRFNH